MVDASNKSRARASASSRNGNNAISQEQPHTVDVTITMLELNGVKCGKTNQKPVRAKRFSRFGSKTSHSGIGSSDTASSSLAPVKAVVWFRRTVPESGKSMTSYYPSLPFSGKFMDKEGNILMSSLWPEEGNKSFDNRTTISGEDFKINNHDPSTSFSRDIRKIVVEDKGKKEGKCVYVPDLVSLRVGLLLAGEEEIFPLGVATIMISGEKQMLDLRIPVDPAHGDTFSIYRKKHLARLGIKPKKLFKKDSGFDYTVSPSTVLKVRLKVTPKPVLNRVPPAGPNSSKLVKEKSKAKPSRVKLGRRQGKSKTSIFNQFLQSKEPRKTKGSQMQDIQEESPWQVDEVSPAAAITVVTPSYDADCHSTEAILDATTQDVDSVLGATSACDTPASPSSDHKSTSQSSVTKTVSTEVTSSSSGSPTSVAAPIDTASPKVPAVLIHPTPGGSLATETTPTKTNTSPRLGALPNSPTNGEDDYSIAERSEHLLFEDEKSGISYQFEISVEGEHTSPRNGINSWTGQDQVHDRFGSNIISPENKKDDIVFLKDRNDNSSLHNKKADIPFLKDKRSVGAPVKENKNDITFIQGVKAGISTPESNNAKILTPDSSNAKILAPENKNFTSTPDNNNANILTPDNKNFTPTPENNNANILTPESNKGGVPMPNGNENMAKHPGKSRNDVRNFEGDIIELKSNMTDIGDLTVESGDEFTIMARSIKVAANENHPQRNEALLFIQRLTCGDEGTPRLQAKNCVPAYECYDCSSTPSINEVMGNFVEGWKDIVTPDEDSGEDAGSVADHTYDSDCASLNSVDETTVAHSVSGHSRSNNSHMNRSSQGKIDGQNMHASDEDNKIEAAGKVEVEGNAEGEADEDAADCSQSQASHSSRRSQTSHSTRRSETSRSTRKSETSRSTRRSWTSRSTVRSKNTYEDYDSFSRTISHGDKECDTIDDETQSTTTRTTLQSYPASADASRCSLDDSSSVRSKGIEQPAAIERAMSRSERSSDQNWIASKGSEISRRSTASRKSNAESDSNSVFTEYSSRSKGKTARETEVPMDERSISSRGSRASKSRPIVANKSGLSLRSNPLKQPEEEEQTVASQRSLSSSSKSSKSRASSKPRSTECLDNDIQDNTQEDPKMNDPLEVCRTSSRQSVVSRGTVCA